MVLFVSKPFLVYNFGKLVKGLISRVGVSPILLIAVCQMPKLAGVNGLIARVGVSLIRLIAECQMPKHWRERAFSACVIKSTDTDRAVTPCTSCQ